MFEKGELDDYQSPTPSLLTISGPWLTIFCGDQRSPIGTAIALERPDKDPLYAMITAQLGQNRVRAWLPAPPEDLVEGTPVRATDQPAGFSFPEDGQLLPSAHLLRPARIDDLPALPSAPSMPDLQGIRPALSLGFRSLDTLTPLCTDGINLIVDAGASLENAPASTSLIQKTIEALEPKTILTVSQVSLPPTDAAKISIPLGETLSEHLTALQLSISMGPLLRDAAPALAIIDLPTPTPFQEGPRDPGAPNAGMAAIVDLLGRHLVATQEASLTVILRLCLDDHLRDLSEIIETLDLGDVDARIYINAENRFDPGRSISRADLDDTADLHRQELLHLLTVADRAREKASIFGPHDLTPEEELALEKTEALHQQILP